MYLNSRPGPLICNLLPNMTWFNRWLFLLQIPIENSMPENDSQYVLHILLKNQTPSNMHILNICTIGLQDKSNN